MSGKLVYIAPNPIEIRCANSITSKILDQVSAFNHYFDTYLIGYGESNIAVFHCGSIEYYEDSKNTRYNLYRCAKELLKKVSPDYCYIRYGYCESSFLRLLSVAKDTIKSKKIVVELPTYPYDKEMWGKGYKYRIINLVDRLTRKKMRKYVAAFSTFSCDKTIWGIDAVHIINGLDFRKIFVRKTEQFDDVIDLIAVSAMGFNHAYERVIDGINDYYEKGGSRKIIFHMVGNGKDLIKYQDRVREYHLEERVLFYGYLRGEELDSVYDKADVAIASLGMHRAGIFLASTLKTREYGAKGLPIVTSCKIDCYDEKWKYLLNVPADESPIDIESIVRFNDFIYLEHKNETVAREIRESVMKVCDVNQTMRPVIDYFLN